MRGDLRHVHRTDVGPMIKEFEFEVSANMKQTDESLLKLVRRIPHNEKKQFTGFAWSSLEKISDRKARATIVGVTMPGGSDISV